jgi:hypothetical protein
LSPGINFAQASLRRFGGVHAAIVNPFTRRGVWPRAKDRQASTAEKRNPQNVVMEGPGSTINEKIEICSKAGAQFNN